MKATTKIWVNRIRKAIPWIYLIVYGAVWIAFTDSLKDVTSGDSLLRPEFEYNLSQLTAYFQIVMLAVFILILFFLLRYVFARDCMKGYRIKMLEKEVDRLKARIESQSLVLTKHSEWIKQEEFDNEGDLGDSDGKSDIE